MARLGGRGYGMPRERAGTHQGRRQGHARLVLCELIAHHPWHAAVRSSRTISAPCYVSQKITQAPLPVTTHPRTPRIARRTRSFMHISMLLKTHTHTHFWFQLYNLEDAYTVINHHTRTSPTARSRHSYNTFILVSTPFKPRTLPSAPLRRNPPWSGAVTPIIPCFAFCDRLNP